MLGYHCPRFRKESNPASRKRNGTVPIGLTYFIIGFLFAILYFVSLGGGMDAPSNAGFGMFPVAFAASVTIATLLTVATPIIVSVVALIKGIFVRKK